MLHRPRPRVQVDARAKAVLWDSTVLFINPKRFRSHVGDTSVCSCHVQLLRGNQLLGDLTRTKRALARWTGKGLAVRGPALLKTEDE